EPDMVDANHISHPGKTFDKRIEVGKYRARRPDANNSTRPGDDSRMIGRDLPACRARRTCHRSVRQDKRLGGNGSGTLDEVIGPMGGVDDDPAPVAGADHLHAEIGQSAMYRRFGLDVAELIDAVMGQLQMAQSISRISLV